ncbi:uncharacterized protein LOC125768263 [Anopheles funestus]|uniref:uncharacterized protein LOC125768263 n=1 Tax=Anopheles funestus TaxID=62324 RepID=UPI0020C647E1|nr:uncharacterized protein LOC125768263 [Anopheles funestus]
MSRVQKESNAALHRLVDDFDRHVKMLHQLGEPTEQWSTILEYVLCTKLPEETLKNWEDHASTLDTPDYATLIDFLQRKMRILESISMNHQSTKESTHPNPVRRAPQQLSSCSSTTSNSKECPYCQHEHALSSCYKYCRLPLSERIQIANEKKVCNNCLRKGHWARNCLTSSRCKHCRDRHHTLLHRSNEPAGSKEGSPERPDSPKPKDRAYAQSLNVTETTERSEEVFLLTVRVNIVDADGKEHSVRALLDSASQASLMTERIARLLQIKRSPANVKVLGAGKVSRNVRESVFAEIRSKRQHFSCGVQFMLMDQITSNIPSENIAISHWCIPKGIELADPEFNKSQPIDLLIGAKHYYSFFPSAARVHLGPDLPSLIDSVFGWIVAGSAMLHYPANSQTIISNAVCMMSLEESMERFWKIESLVMKDGYSPEERRCEQLFQTTTTRDKDGRYIVRLTRHPDFGVRLGASKTSAKRRFELLEKRFVRNAKLKEEYHAFMKEYYELGHMRLVRDELPEPVESYYLPHHPVFKESSTTTKIRVVFDGSSKTTSGYSLNEALCVGPVVQDELLDQLLRFRTYRVALVGDIAKMYRQILLHPDDRPLVRIFFRFSTQQPVQIYELNTVTYGLAPSSFLATRALIQLADDEGDAYPRAGPALRKNFYVDDFIGGANSVEEATLLRDELAELLLKGGFELRKWTSNCPDVLRGLDESQIGTTSKMSFASHEAVKTLGISWVPQEDWLLFEGLCQPDTDVITKRSVLSTIAKMYDPLGMIAPIVIRAKMIMQEIWTYSCDWDDALPAGIVSKWKQLQQEIQSLSQYRMERYVLVPGARKIELHTFSDASTVAYGACTYVRCEEPGRARVMLLASKSKVAPLKQLTVARLELCACVLAAHLHHRIKRAIATNIDASWFWTDSAICTAWIRAPPTTWKTFVANRVAEIQHFTSDAKWRHIAGVENPADLVSRGMEVLEFNNSMAWRHGPAWLAKPEDVWPMSDPTEPSEAIQEKKVLTAAVATCTNELFLRWSSFTRLVNVVGYCRRFIAMVPHLRRIRREGAMHSNEGNAHSSNSASPKVLSVLERAAAEDALLRLAQRESFAEELSDLQTGKQIRRQSQLRRLTPFLDKKGIIRVGGRLNLAQLPFQSKHPALLPKGHPLARLIAESYHKLLLHGGGRLLLSSIRERFWPLNGRMLVKAVVRNCIRCIRHHPTAAEQHTGQLPSGRLVPSRPFAVTGVDYAGPLYLKPAHRRAASLKAYLCVFVCFTTKAVHLELVGDLSTEGFLAALRRFTARRGVPEHIHSDNVGSSMTAIPDPELTHAHINTEQHLTKLQLLVQKFWKHWQKEYLQELQKDPRIAKNADNIQPGRMVIVVDELLPTTRWPLARVVEVHPGADGLVRVVTLRTPKGIIKRPITKICPLPISSENVGA